MTGGLLARQSYRGADVASPGRLRVRPQGSHAAHPALRLQATIGNRRLARLLRAQRPAGRAAVATIPTGARIPARTRLLARQGDPKPGAGAPQGTASQWAERMTKRIEERTGIERRSVGYEPLPDYWCPGPTTPGLVGSCFPVPATVEDEPTTGRGIRKRPATGQGTWLTAPSFSLRLDPRLAVGGILDQVDLGGFRLTNPTIVFNRKTDRLEGRATVSLSTEATRGFASKFSVAEAPTEIDVRIRSTPLGRFDVQGSYGPFVTDLTLTLDYDSEPLRRFLGTAIEAAVAGDPLALPGLLGQVSGLPKSGTIGFSGSFGIGGTARKLPLNYLRGSVELGPQGARGWAGAAGLIGLPAGTFLPDLGVPALGAAGAYGSARRSGAYSGVFGFAGVTGKPSLPAISKLDLAGMIEPFAYAQVTAARRTANGHELGIRISAQYQLGGAGQEAGPVEQLRLGIYDERQRERYATAKEYTKEENIDPAVRSRWAGFGGQPEGALSGGVVVFGTFDLLGGK